MMSIIVSSQDEIRENIKNFHKELGLFESSKDIDIKVLIDNMPNIRAWYVLKEGGKYYFAPSKYIGYKDMKASTYCRYRKELDGRKTEKALSSYYQEISEKHPDFSQLNSELIEYCSLYGKTPNSLFRINIPLENQDEEAFENDVIELIWKVYLGLSKKNMVFFRAKLNRHQIK